MKRGRDQQQKKELHIFNHLERFIEGKKLGKEKWARMRRGEKSGQRGFQR